MENEFIEVESANGLVSVSVEDIPEIITSSIENISKLEDEVRKAESSANKAMDYVGGQMTRYEEKGKWIFKHRAGDTKDIIEDTQEAVEKLAEAQQVSVKALKKSFEFQKKLAETSRYLFGLGCANITVNRIAVRQIELKMSGAGKEKISDLAKQEFMTVVKQLKQQEDILKKQEFLTSKVKDTVSRLNKKDDIDNEQSCKIESLSLENKNIEEKITGIHKHLSNKDRVDSEQAQRLKNIDDILLEKESIDKKQEVSIAENRSLIDMNTEAIKMLLEYTKQKDILDKKQSDEIGTLKNKPYAKLCISAIAIAIVSLALSFINMFF